MTTAAILIKARELIATPDKWCQGTYAEDCLGVEVDSEDPSAVCFCMLGAVVRAKYELSAPTVYDAIKALECVIKGPVGLFNDTPGLRHATVIRKIDAAIAKEKQA